MSEFENYTPPHVEDSYEAEANGEQEYLSKLQEELPYFMEKVAPTEYGLEWKQEITPTDIEKLCSVLQTEPGRYRVLTATARVMDYPLNPDEIKKIIEIDGHFSESRTNLKDNAVRLGLSSEEADKLVAELPDIFAMDNMIHAKAFKFRAAVAEKAQSAFDEGGYTFSEESLNRALKEKQWQVVERILNCSADDLDDDDYLLFRGKLIAWINKYSPEVIPELREDYKSKILGEIEIASAAKFPSHSGQYNTDYTYQLLELGEYYRAQQLAEASQKVGDYYEDPEYWPKMPKEYADKINILAATLNKLGSIKPK